MVYMYHSFLIHSSADGHLGCFHVLAMINSAAMDIGVHVSLSDLVFLVCMPRSGITTCFTTYFLLTLYSIIFINIDYFQILSVIITCQSSLITIGKINIYIWLCSCFHLYLDKANTI